jgi:hypothetical protein
MDIFNKFIQKNLHLLIGLAPINQVLLENLMFFYKLTQKKERSQAKNYFKLCSIVFCSRSMDIVHSSWTFFSKKISSKYFMDIVHITWTFSTSHGHFPWPIVHETNKAQDLNSALNLGWNDVLNIVIWSICAKLGEKGSNARKRFTA